MARKKQNIAKSVETLTHDEARRRVIPTAEHQPLLDETMQAPVRVAYERRNRDLDPQLVWRGKYSSFNGQDEADLTVNAPPLYIQEKVHPKALIDDLQRESKAREHGDGQLTPDLFADFNGLPKGADRTEFYQFDANWQNRMILGDSLQVMASLAEREGLRGQVQCIYLDPPYGIKFNSNFQWSTTSRDVKDGKAEHITREPEQVKAFRDTWRDGIHSYLTYLRDRLTVARDLLHESGSIFVQIGDENVHRVRALMDEVLGENNCVAQIATKTSGSSTGVYLPGVVDYILWFGKNLDALKYRPLFGGKSLGENGAGKYNRLRLPNLETRPLTEQEKRLQVPTPENAYVYRQDNLTSQSVGRDKGEGAASWFPVPIQGKVVQPSHRIRWKTNEQGMSRLLRGDRIELTGISLSYVRYLDDFAATLSTNFWSDIGGVQSRADPKVYVVQSPTVAIQRCVLMTTDTGDLVLDPTCGAGTTATVAEQWGRRWITIDTSRVALALARARIMGARYPYYLLADSPEGQHKEAELTRSTTSTASTRGDIRQGFVYERVPHITLKSIANNAEIDVIWERFQPGLETLREKLNEMLGETWEEWELPREPDDDWPVEAKDAHKQWWEARIARQQEIDASISAKADSEYLYDKPYPDPQKVRVAGPFTVESISPHRTLGVDENGEPIDPADRKDIRDGDAEPQDFVAMILDNLRTAGVQQAHKDGAIQFATLTPWPGDLICAVGTYQASDKWAVASGEPKDARATDHSPLSTEYRAAIFIGPEFGTVSRADLVDAAREAAEGDFDVLICCAFNYAAHTTELEKLGRLPVLKARMNADLHMATELKKTDKGNLFVIFGEPDIDIEDTGDNRVRVKINGVDVFHPNTGEVRADGPEGIACWFIDTDYNSESFFVRHAYFLGAADPYKSLKTTLKAEINEEAWETLRSDTSRAFAKPKDGRIAVKVINHLGDEVMKVFRV